MIRSALDCRHRAHKTQRVAATASKQAETIVVVGAGVIGLAIAFRLAREFGDVTLIDRGEPGMGCSFGNAGHIATEQIFPLASPATFFAAPRLLLRRDRPLSIRRQYALRASPWLLRFAWASRPSAFRRGTAALASLQSGAMASLQELYDEAGIGALLHRRGHLILVENEKSVAGANKQIRAFTDHGINAQWKSPEDVLALAPELKKNIAGGIYVADSGHVADPMQSCRGLFDAFNLSGGKFIRQEVHDIAPGEGPVRLTLSGDSLHAQTVVIAAGAWSRKLAAVTGFDVPLDTERGYHVMADGWRGNFEMPIASLERMTIMTPLDAGLRITGFVEFGGLDLPAHPSRIATLKRHLDELLPDADMPPESSWLGFRPSLPDHLPVISRSPGNGNVFYAFGHQHLGLTLAGVTADVVLSMMRGKEHRIDTRPFRIDRF